MKWNLSALVILLFTTAGCLEKQPEACEDSGSCHPTSPAPGSASFKFTYLSDLGIPGRKKNKMVSTDSGVIIWGGETDDASPYSTAVYLFDLDTKNIGVHSSAPYALTGFNLAWDGSQLVAIGNLASGGSAQDRYQRYNSQTDTWDQISSTNAPRYNGCAPLDYSPTYTAKLASGKIYVFDWLKDGYSWSNGVNSCYGENKYYFFGGIYSPNTDTWESLASPTGTIPTLDYYGRAWTNSGLVIWGGNEIASNNSSTLTNIGGIYQPDSKTWKRFTYSDVTPFPTNAFAMTSADDKVVIWGGNTPSGITNLGYVYDTKLDKWKYTSVTNAPSPRVNPMSIFTGRYVVVWGGEDGRGFRDYFNDGGIYDIEKDIWYPIPSHGQFSGRDSLTSSIVWHQNKLFIYGGTNGTDKFADALIIKFDISD